MLNLKKKNKVENLAHFKNDVFFLKNPPSQYFVFFDRTEAFAKTKK
jgi:hypothetical protein